MEAAGYQYTVDTPTSVLTDEQRREYEEKGFIVVKGLLKPQELERWQQRFLDLANGVVERAPTMTMMRDVAIAKQKGMGERAITKLQDWQDDPVLFEFCKHPAVLRYVTSIIGPNVKSVHTMLINKPPDVGMGSSRHPAHQDLWYFPFRPADKIVCAWTAMQRIDRQNGCLFVLPGSHRRGQLLKHEYPKDGVVNKAYHGIQNLSSEKDGDNMTHVVMEAGDTIFFHPLLIHGSGRNSSTGYRKAISCHYGASDCHYEDLSGTIQQDVAQEIEGVVRAKGLELSYNDIWKLKCRLVAGREGTL